MIYGGLIFRVVTPNYPGDPAFDSFGPIRTEYLAQTEPRTWTMSRDQAFFFPRHLDAVNVARTIPHCHPAVATNNLRAESASSSGAEQQAELESNILIRDSAPRSQNSLPVPVLAGSEPVSLERAGHCDPARGSTTKRPTPNGVAARPANDGHSRGGQNSKRNRMTALKRAHERTTPPDSERFWWKQGQMA